MSPNISEEDATRIARAMVREHSVLAGVTPENARERLSNLKYNPEWVARVNRGEPEPLRQLHELSVMAAEHEQAETQRHVEAETARWNAEQADAAAAKQAEEDRVRVGLEKQFNNVGRAQ